MNRGRLSPSNISRDLGRFGKTLAVQTPAGCLCVVACATHEYGKRRAYIELCDSIPSDWSWRAFGHDWISLPYLSFWLSEAKASIVGAIRITRVLMGAEFAHLAASICWRKMDVAPSTNGKHLICGTLTQKG